MQHAQSDHVREVECMLPGRPHWTEFLRQGLYRNEQRSETRYPLWHLCTLGSGEHIHQDRVVRCQGGDDLFAIYEPTANLSAYESGVASGGAVVASEVIPFSEIRGIWRFTSTKRGPIKNMRRILLSDCQIVENETCPGCCGRDPVDFLSNLSDHLKDDDSDDSDIVRGLVVKACDSHSLAGCPRQQYVRGLPGR